MTLTPVEAWVVGSDSLLHRRGRTPLGVDEVFIDYQTQPTLTNTGAYAINEPGRQQITGSSPLIVTQNDKEYVDVDFWVPVIRVRAARVKFINCTHHGQQWEPGDPVSSNTTTLYDALIDCRDTACVECYIERNTFQPDYPTWTYTGVIGHDFDSYRNQYLHLNDGIGMYRTQTANVDNNASSRCDYIDKHAYFEGDAGVVHPSDTKTHNDCIQIQSGWRSKVWGSYLGGFCDPAVGNALPPRSPWYQINACIQMNELNIDGTIFHSYYNDFQYNWMDGGGQMLNGASVNPQSGMPNDFGTISYNRVGPHGYLPGQELTIGNDVAHTAEGNIYWVDGSPCPVKTNG